MNSNYDVIIIGGGPAGLTAGIYLARAKRRTVLLGEKIFDSPIADLELIENYPGYGEPVSGAVLIGNMINQAIEFGLSLEQVAVTRIERFSEGNQAISSDGRIFMAKVLIIATGTFHKKLDVPGEDMLRGKGVFNCALCDGGKFSGKVIAVCGGGDAGVTEAIYMTKLASKVVLIEALPSLTACGILKDRVFANDKIELHCETKVIEILGKNYVEAIKIVDPCAKEQIIEVSAVLVQIGLKPNTGFLNNILPLDDHGHIIVNGKMESKCFGIFAAGDVRSGSPNQIVTAAGDGATAAIAADKFLQQL